MASSIVVSIIIPVYNVEAYIRKCATSLFDTQRFFPENSIEYIFVDDCTPDNSLQVLKDVIEDYQKSRPLIVKIISHSNNKGLVDARATGFRYSRGRYVAFCDSDDWVDPNMYANLYHKAIEDESDLVYCGYKSVHNGGQTRPIVEIDHPPVPFNPDINLFITAYLSQGLTSVCLLLVKRDLLREYNWNSISGHQYLEDFHLVFYLLANVDSISCLNESPYHYNQMNTMSICHTFSRRVMSDSLFILSDTVSLLDEMDSAKAQALRRSVMWRVLNVKQDLILDPRNHAEYLSIMPESFSYIVSCPFLNMKMKVMALLLVHHMRPLLLVVLFFRKMFVRI